MGQRPREMRVNFTEYPDCPRAGSGFDSSIHAGFSGFVRIIRTNDFPQSVEITGAIAPSRRAVAITVHDVKEPRELAAPNVLNGQEREFRRTQRM
jgi:hypothetical protein